MEYVAVDEELARLNRAGDWGKAYQIGELLQVFPDLKMYRDHYGRIRFCSKAANDQVDSMELDTCHDCDGKPIKLWPYVVISPKGDRLYSDPPVFYVADQNVQGFGYIPRAEWREILEAAGIHLSVIRKVDHALKAHPPINYFEDGDGQGSGTGEGSNGSPG